MAGLQKLGELLESPRGKLGYCPCPPLSRQRQGGLFLLPSHMFLPWVDSVRALWRNTRMNLLNSFPERLTTLKTNFVVSEQVNYSHFTSCPHSPVEPGTFLSTYLPCPPPPAPSSNISSRVGFRYPWLTRLGLFLSILFLSSCRISGSLT